MRAEVFMGERAKSGDLRAAFRKRGRSESDSGRFNCARCDVDGQRMHLGEE